MRQVNEHPGSGEYQHSFRGLASSFGWEDGLIVAIDADDGISGTGALDRKGFQWLRQQIYDGQVGAVFCWEASRLARDNSDFAQLIKLCAAYDTLIVDEKGVYDPNNINDRILLGIMGVLNEAEVRRLADRSSAVKRMRAEKGELRLRPATGYAHDDKGKLVLDPDPKVQDAFWLFFSTFDKHGSATKVVKHFNRNEITFPTLKRSPGKKGEIVWGEITTCRALGILRNPMYAGTYAFCRSKASSEMLSADSSDQKKRKVKLSLDSEGIILIHDSHEGYISWEKFEENQKRIEDNRYSYAAGCRGAVRDGSALLQGVVLCGKCLTNLKIRYSARGHNGSYVCDQEVTHLGKFACLSISMKRLDSIVTEALLEAVSTAQLRLTLEGLEEVDKESREDDRHELEELETARSERNKAQRRFDAIDPENTLVFKEYEKKLQEKMREVTRLEKKHSKALKKSRQALTDEVLQLVLALPQDLRAFWECEAVTNAERKQLLRYLISQVTIKRRESSQYQDVTIHWVSGAVTTLVIPKQGNRLHPEAIELMRKLATDHTLTQIIDRLHDAGFKPTRWVARFTPGSLQHIFKEYGIKVACPEAPRDGAAPRGDGRYPASAVAKMLNVSVPIVHRLCKNGDLDMTRKMPNGAYWIKIDPEQVSALKKLYAVRGYQSSTEVKPLMPVTLPKPGNSSLQT